MRDTPYTFPRVRRPAVRTAQPGRAMATDEGGSAFGERLRRFAWRRGLSQEALAERAGLSTQAIGALETGKRRRPYPHTVALLADALGSPRGSGRRWPTARVSRSPAAASRTLALCRRGLTPLVGREEEVRASCAALRAGEGPAADADRPRRRRQDPPGARGRGRRRRGAFADGVAFVALAADRRPRPRRVRRSPRRSGCASTGQRSPDEVVRAALRAAPLLLVLDNFEHLLEAAPLVADLLAACPRLTVLATSRAPLRLTGEHEVPVAAAGAARSATGARPPAEIARRRRRPPLRRAGAGGRPPSR